MVLQQPVEERRSQEQVGVLHVGDGLGDGVGGAQALRHPLGEPAARHRIGPGDAEARVDARRQPEVVDVTPHRPVRDVLDEGPGAQVGAPAGRS